MTEAPETDQPRQVPPLVIIGASAGGIDALLTLVSMLPADFPAPVVVAQPLDPPLASHLSETLPRRSALPVRTVEDHDEIAGGAIYVVPADRHAEFSGRTVHTQLMAAPPIRSSIDRLLSTAARAFTSDVIAVILGVEGEGAAGAQAVKAHGGTVIVQQPRNALVPGPPFAVPASAVDIVAAVEAIPPLLADLVSQVDAVGSPAQERYFRAVLDRVRESTGLDLSLQTRQKIVSRLQRRMAAVGTTNLEDYQQYIDRHPEELPRLATSVLFNTTKFFRDPDLFDHLRDHVLPPLLSEAREHGELRIWCAGCATGEDAYTLAMIVRDLIADDADITVRIFATDVAASTIEFARRGVYPAAALNELPADAIARHFTDVNGFHEVREHVRSLVVFAAHDLGYRAPFPRIDLILSHGVLMNFTPELQRRTLQHFALSLRHGGVLVLGTGEPAEPLPAAFTVENPRRRIFRAGEPSPILPDRASHQQPLAIPAARRQRLQSPLLPSSVRPPPEPERERGPSFGQQATRLLERLEIGALVVDRGYHIRAINNAARRLLAIHTAGLGEDLIHAVPATLADPLRALLDAALRGETRSANVHVQDRVTADEHDLLMSAYPMTADDKPPDEVVVEAVEVTQLARQLRESAAERDRLPLETERAERAIDEVRQLRHANLHMANESARLRVENEELLVASEEAQAAAEEIETLNEELQATNEELETLNEELQATIEELTTTNDELEARTVEMLDAATARDADRQRLEAILAAMSDAVLVVASDGQPLLTNAAYDRLFGDRHALLPEDDLGQPLPEALWPQPRAADGESFTLPFTKRDREHGRGWFEAQGQPLFIDGVRHGGVIVIRDVSDRSLRRIQEQFLATAGHELRTPLTALSLSLDLAARRSARTDDERLRQHIDRALDQARRLSALVVELVDVVRLQTSTLQLRREPVDLTEQARAAIETARIIAVDQPIALHSDGPIMISADRRRIEQVLLNLLVNAIRFAPSTEPIDVSPRFADGMAEIEVRDKGPGIPAEALPHIFDRFFRVDSDQSPSEGLGLGLFIAREIVTAHGGTITASSREGDGARFVVRLPLSDTTEPGNETRQQDQQGSTA